jgi:hypothetical protein
MSENDSQTNEIMAGNINPHGGKKFSKEYQPERRRVSTKFMTDLLVKELKGERNIEIKGIDPETGLEKTVRVPMPTKQTIIQALLRAAASGNTKAIEIVLDRTEGKVPQPLTGQDGEPLIPKTDVDYSKLSDEVLTAIINAKQDAPKD